MNFNEAANDNVDPVQVDVDQFNHQYRACERLFDETPLWLKQKWYQKFEYIRNFYGYSPAERIVVPGEFIERHGCDINRFVGWYAEKYLPEQAPT